MIQHQVSAPIRQFDQVSRLHPLLEGVEGTLLQRRHGEEETHCPGSIISELFRGDHFQLDGHEYQAGDAQPRHHRQYDEGNPRS